MLVFEGCVQGCALCSTCKRPLRVGVSSGTYSQFHKGQLWDIELVSENSVGNNWNLTGFY